MRDEVQKTPEQAEIEGRLQQRWLSFWQRVGAQVNSEPFFQELVERYSEPHRAYHTLRHIDDCLTELDSIRDHAVNPDAIEMAIWYHDVIYDQVEKKEERSADFAVKVAAEMGLREDFATEVFRLVLTTKHLSIPEDNDARLLADIDLTILGQAPQRFDQYEDDVRKEYSHVDDMAFSRGRSTVMKSFKERGQIYSTEFFRDKYELSARSNLERSLQRWG